MAARDATRTLGFLFFWLVRNAFWETCLQQGFIISYALQGMLPSGLYSIDSDTYVKPKGYSLIAKMSIQFIPSHPWLDKSNDESQDHLLYCGFDKFARQCPSACDPIATMWRQKIMMIFRWMACQAGSDWWHQSVWHRDLQDWRWRGLETWWRGFWNREQFLFHACLDKMLFSSKANACGCYCTAFSHLMLRELYCLIWAWCVESYWCSHLYHSFVPAGGIHKGRKRRVLNALQHPDFQTFEFDVALLQ